MERDERRNWFRLLIFLSGLLIALNILSGILGFYQLI